MNYYYVTNLIFNKIKKKKKYKKYIKYKKFINKYYLKIF